MPGGSLNPQGNIIFQTVIYASLIPASALATDSSSTQTYTINGLIPNDIVELFPQVSLATSTTYLTIGSVWVSAANTLSVQWVNSTGSTSGTITTGVNFLLMVWRCALGPYTLNSSNWPTALE